MAEKRKPYSILVYIAYAYFILLGAVWFVVSLTGGGHFNYNAFLLVAVVSIQAYFQHRLTNLILGILLMFFSIFTLLDVMSTFDMLSKKAVIDGMAKAFLSFAIISIIMSGILIFSYIKLHNHDE